MSDSQGCVVEWSIGHLQYLRKANGVLAQTKKARRTRGCDGAIRRSPSTAWGAEMCPVRTDRGKSYARRLRGVY